MTSPAGQPEPEERPTGIGPRRAGRPDRRVQGLVIGAAAACHVGLFMVLSLSPKRPPEPAPVPETVTAMLVAPTPPPPPEPIPPDRPEQKAPSPPAPATPVRAEPATPARTIPKLRPPRTPPPADVPTLAAVKGPTKDPDVVLGEAALAGATVAGAGSGQGGSGAGSGGGGGGGQCDMVRRLQDALRSDPEVTAAITRSHRSLGPGGKAILVWNGEWLRSPGQDGKGLAGVRQAIAMEVAFAPPACKTQAMRGLVVISFADGPGSPRLALGSGSWRWSELLSARR